MIISENKLRKIIRDILIEKKELKKGKINEWHIDGVDKSLAFYVFEFKEISQDVMLYLFCCSDEYESVKSVYNKSNEQVGIEVLTNCGYNNEISPVKLVKFTKCQLVNPYCMNSLPKDIHSSFVKEIGVMFGESGGYIQILAKNGCEFESFYFER